MYRSTIHKIIGVLLVMFSLLTGCKEIETTTEIYPDGSCKHIVFVKGDSSEIAQSAFPIPTDSSWTITTYDSGEYTYIAEKIFAKVADWDKEMNYCQDKSKALTIVPELKKKFRWFYTIYEYKETFKAFNKLWNVPITDYMTPEDLQIFSSPDDSSAQAKAAEEKLDNWDKRNKFEEFYQEFIKMTRELKDSTLSIARLDTKKEQLYNLFVDELYDNLKYEKELMTKLCTILDNDSVKRLESDLVYIIAQQKERQESLEEIGLTEFENHVIMPGLILDTNAQTVEGRKVSWEIKPKQFWFTDFTMSVESRLVNIWAVVITLVLFFIAVLILLLPLILRKKK